MASSTEWLWLQTLYPVLCVLTNSLSGKDQYPHTFENRPQKSANPLKWLFEDGETFDFPNCQSVRIFRVFPPTRTAPRPANDVLHPIYKRLCFLAPQLSPKIGRTDAEILDRVSF